MPGGELHPSGLGYVMDPEVERACTRPSWKLQDPDLLVPSVRWHPSAADHHDRQESCGEIECERCSPEELADGLPHGEGWCW